MKELLEAIDVGLNSRYVVLDGDDHTLCIKDRETGKCFDVVVKDSGE